MKNNPKPLVLFLNGTINLDFCVEYLHSNYADIDMICTDGAYDKLKDDSRISLGKVIGDFDSISDIDISNDLFIYNRCQDTTDFEKALEYIVSQDISEIIVMGSSEGEMDHFLSNISTAIKYQNTVKIKFIDENAQYFLIPKKFSISGVQDRTISVIPMPIATDVYYKGLKYGLSGQDLEFGRMIGSRNLAESDDIEINYTSGEILLFISH